MPIDGILLLSLFILNEHGIDDVLCLLLLLLAMIMLSYHQKQKPGSNKSILGFEK